MLVVVLVGLRVITRVLLLGETVHLVEHWWQVLHLVRLRRHAHVHWMRRHMSRVARHGRSTTTRRLLRKHGRLSDTRDELSRWHVGNAAVRSYRVVLRGVHASAWLDWIRITEGRWLEGTWTMLLHIWRRCHRRWMLLLHRATNLIGCLLLVLLLMYLGNDFFQESLQLIFLPPGSTKLVDDWK